MKFSAAVRRSLLLTTPLVIGLCTGCAEAHDLGKVAGVRSQVQDTDPLVSYRSDQGGQVPHHHGASGRLEGSARLVQASYPRH